jgi:hypothetical protein
MHASEDDADVGLDGRDDPDDGSVICLVSNRINSGRSYRSIGIPRRACGCSKCERFQQCRRCPVSRSKREAICLPNANDEEENDAELLLRRDLDAPQELNRPEVDNEVSGAVDHTSDDVENAGIDAVLGLDGRLPVRRSRSVVLVLLQVRLRNVPALQNGDQNCADGVAAEANDHGPAEDGVPFCGKEEQIREAD